ncbi:uracil-DNA glycosylase-like [Hylaeus volcanicus]|uniref:uracil-DNA glycosylase-like n=1 Tax=Hylaeus volcanicus TaxID=313075 RepID=UPI0023B79B3D|nr:uracil-DNA glycosylase-like [Hylaeus volcanicus]
MGLAFSVPPDLKRLPPSLVNIYKEVVQDTTQKPLHGDLTCWATQGVLLLNSILTVRKGAPMSHKHYGWEQFTDNVLKIINKNTTNTVFLLWGKPAQKKVIFIDSNKHYVLTAGHPSPLSWRYFRGCQHFSKTNDYLRSVGKQCVNWMQPWKSNGS